MSRPMVLAMLGLSLVASVPAHAAPRQAASCMLVRDAVGDTTSVAPNAVDRQLDITSADVAVDEREVVVVVRLDALEAADPTAPQGRTYEFDFTAKEQNFLFVASLLTGGSTFGVYISDQRVEENKSGARSATGIGPAQGTVDVAHRQLIMRAPLSVFAPHARLLSGTAVYHLAAFTYRANGTAAESVVAGHRPGAAASAGLGVDQAWGRSTTYRVGRPNCANR